MTEGLKLLDTCETCMGGHKDYTKDLFIIRIYKKVNRIEIYRDGFRLARFTKDKWKEKYKEHGII